MKEQVHRLNGELNSSQGKDNDSDLILSGIYLESGERHPTIITASKVWAKPTKKRNKIPHKIKINKDKTLTKRRERQLFYYWHEKIDDLLLLSQKEVVEKIVLMARVYYFGEKERFFIKLLLF